MPFANLKAVAVRTLAQVLLQPLGELYCGLSDPAHFCDGSRALQHFYSALRRSKRNSVDDFIALSPAILPADPLNPLIMNLSFLHRSAERMLGPRSFAALTAACVRF